MTPEQAQWLYDHRNEVKCVSIGLGSDGYPAPRDGWILLKNGRSLWLSPEGETRPA